MIQEKGQRSFSLGTDTDRATGRVKWIYLYISTGVNRMNHVRVNVKDMPCDRNYGTRGTEKRDVLVYQNRSRPLLTCLPQGRRQLSHLSRKLFLTPRWHVSVFFILINPPVHRQRFSEMPHTGTPQVSIRWEPLWESHVTWEWCPDRFSSLTHGGRQHSSWLHWQKKWWKKKKKKRQLVLNVWHNHH